MRRASVPLVVILCMAAVHALAWSVVLYIRFLRGRGSFAALEKWQTDYLPVYGAWAALVVIILPPLFRYS